MRDSLLFSPGSTAAAASPAFTFAGLFFRQLPTWGETDDGQRDGGWKAGRICTPDGVSPWQEYWGESYGLELKRWMLTPVFSRLEAERKIGDLVIDVGCGAVPVTGLLKATPARRRILVDIASDNAESAEALGIRLDAEEAGRRENLACRKALLRACAFLAINPRSEPRTDLADTIVFSEILNYVDFRKVIQAFSFFLKPGGRIIVVNLPFRGNGSLFSEMGLKENRQLYEFLDERDFEIEFKAFPKRPAWETDESQEFIILVAKKPFQSNRIHGPDLNRRNQNPKHK
jgi:SAM-dependent methyltransferase